jgi:hypothetical protein
LSGSACHRLLLLDEKVSEEKVNIVIITIIIALHPRRGSETEAVADAKCSD